MRILDTIDEMAFEELANCYDDLYFRRENIAWRAKEGGITMAKRVTSIGFDPRIIPALEERGMLGPTVNRDLERLYTLYDRALRRVSLTVDEACLIVDALNDSLYDARTAGLLPAGVRDAIQLDGLAEKWGVDGDALVQKLSALDELSCMAIIDAAERFWANEKYRDMDIREAVTECFGIQG